MTGVGAADAAPGPSSALADSFPGMYFAHRLAYERFELPGLVVHADVASAFSTLPSGNSTRGS